MPQHSSYSAETATCRRVALNPDCRWIFTKHALDRMAERGIEAADVERVLTRGQVVLEERKQDILWRVVGTDVDGRRIEIVAAVSETEIVIKVVTVF